MQRIFTLLLVLSSLGLWAQPKPLTYYLPDISYNPDIPTPESFLGYQIGEWHISHDQQLMYMRYIADLSPRMVLRQHAQTYEGRPLVHLIVTSEANHARLEEIQTQHLALSDPEQNRNLNLADMPAVIYQGFSIHGNEPSGANAAPLVAYYLAAAQGSEIDEILNNLVIIFDPSFNPDGLTRFSTWANMHKNKNLTADSNDREYDEVWPGGRTNHYWFDINRDWLPVQHPESRGRIKTFHDWKPNVLTDHHEMGSNSTFFFMPGEPTRVHPLTPKMNQELTGRIAKYHAEALDEIGSLYYSGEGYDDFYYGKGSTYPDANGCIGILFEQASSRGHLQETDNGLLSFPFTIRNQVTTALSTQRAAVGLREDLLKFQQDFYRESMREARADRTAAYVFGDAYDDARNQELVEILRRHRIDVYRLKDNLSLDGEAFAPDHSYAVPLAQPQYRLLRAIFETRTSFEDSLFYDVSAWTLPMAMNIPYAETGRQDILGAKVEGLRVENRAAAVPEQSSYAYLVHWDDYYAPKAVYALLKAGLRAKVATRPLVLENVRYPEGTVMVPARNQRRSPDEVWELIKKAVTDSGVKISPVATGYSPEGPDLGSNDFEPLELPKVLLVIGEGVSSYDAGEIWHLFDQRFDIITNKVELASLSRIDIWEYNTIILPNGSYNSINGVAPTMKRWLQDGGTLITMERAASWAAQNGLSNVKTRKSENEEKDKTRRPYASADRDRGGKVIGGAIFGIEADLSHPLFYGYHRKEMPVFKRGTLFFEPSNNVYATPAVYRNQPLLSGYLNKTYEGKIDNSAAVIVSGIGRGRSIALNFNPNFRAFWYGTNRIFLNSVFFGSTIQGGTVETDD